MMIDVDFLKESLMEYFNIGDSYAYYLTRVKEAFNYNMVSLDDFEEFTEKDIDNIIEFIRNRSEEVKPTVDEIGGTHSEGLGWNPKGGFCGECSYVTCVGCPSNGKDENYEEKFNNRMTGLKKVGIIKVPGLKDTRIYSGYDLGKNIREKFDLDNKDKDGKHYVFIFPKDTMSINNSFFRGLFHDSVKKFGETFEEKYSFMLDDGRELYDILNFNIHEGIYDLLHY